MTKFKHFEMQITRYFSTSPDLDQITQQILAYHTSVAKFKSEWIHVTTLA